jgi:hypothetical protein
VSRDVFTKWRDDHMEKRVDRSKPLWALFVMDRWMRKTTASS